jgi:hypothetical protein
MAKPPDGRHRQRPGHPGRRGPKGGAGKRGARGRIGATGPRGTIGETGPAGTAARTDRLEILTVVEGQIEDIYQELHLQATRITQLQVQLDDVLGKLRRLTDER